MKKLIFNKRTFFKNTYCIFEAIDPVVLEDKVPDFVSRSGSQYFYTDEGVYRVSSHWGRAASCRWRLRVALRNGIYGQKAGFAKWSNFYRDNDVERLYFIQKNDVFGTFEYFHKEEPFYQPEFVLRTASETRKILRQIKTLTFETRWANYIPHENIDTLRSYLIHGLITTTKNLQTLKREAAALYSVD